MNIAKKVVAALVIVAVVFIFICLQNLVQLESNDDAAAKIKPMKKDRYNEYGLLLGQELDTEPYYKDADVVIYMDRVFKRYRLGTENINHMAFVVEKLSGILPEDTNFYIMPIPSRVVLEDGYDEDLKQYELYVEALKEKMGSSVKLVDVLPVLAENSNENIFYRTEDAWTARGAYYGAAELCNSIGILPIPLEGYDEHMYKTVKGAFLQKVANLFEESSEMQSVVWNIKGDPIFLYLLPDCKNTVEVFWHEKGKLINERRPLIRKSATGTAIFLGDNYEWAVADGDAESEKKKSSTLLLICDNVGQMMTSYLANQYKSIYVVNISEYRDLEVNLDNILRHYLITDVVYAQNIENMGNRALSRAVSSMMDTTK
ncbi:MAG: DHHW family protein [Lachnospiraceae bacterium]|nr:DHHW family protein [Lachnospiraceae bacterium]